MQQATRDTKLTTIEVKEWTTNINQEGQSMVEDKKNKDSEEIQTDDLVVHY